MNRSPRPPLAVISLLALLGPAPGALAQNLYDPPATGVETRWISFENLTGAKGAGGQANEGRKGSSSTSIKAGETKTIVEIQGSGVIRRIRATVRRSPEHYRGLVIRMYWDDQTVPSVEAPLHDFFGTPFARQARFESALFASAEGKSYNAFVPMPFRKKARVTIENQSPKDCPRFTCDFDCTVGDALPAELLYFHARYRRENPTTPKKDFEILPRITGKGRYLGANIGVRSLGDYREPIWFGEGEIKIYLDGDRALPTLVGTGTEDLPGGAWGMGKFNLHYGGCLFTEKEDGVWGFYRYHVPDPVYFHQDIRVTLQQMAGASYKEFLGSMAPANFPELTDTHQKFNPVDYTDRRKWLNFEVPQDVCATAYWYQTLPSPDFGPLDSYEQRVRDLAFPDRNP